MDQTPNDVTHLIDRLRAGDRQALGELYHGYRERLRRMVELRMDSRLRTRLDASDGQQEQARAVLAHLREALNQPRWKKNAESLDLMHEARALMALQAATAER